MNFKYKLFYKLLFIFFISFNIICSYNFIVYAGYPKLVNTLLDAFDKIKSYLVAIATPVAAISIASGFLMQKFSLGDEERIRSGKKLIKTSIVSYVFILTLDLIISLIQNLIN